MGVTAQGDRVVGFGRLEDGLRQALVGDLIDPLE
jgi:hypothetical protein